MVKEEGEEGGITAEEGAALDENCGFFGLSALQLMENAGAALASEVKARFGAVGGAAGVKKRVTIIAGKGNNGGDGFVAARHLQGDGHGLRHEFEVRVILLGRSRDLRTEEARRNFRILKESGCEVVEITDSSELSGGLNAEVVVDAIFGTGVRGRVREPEATAIDLVNSAKADAGAFVVSVDVPSGLDAETGVVGSGEPEKAVRADLTVTFHRAKKGLLKSGVKEWVGELVVAGIGIPEGLERLAGPGDLRQVLEGGGRGKRRPSSHKGENGRVLVVGGGAFFGAPALTALASLRAGADWVTVAAPKSVSSVLASFSPNLIVQPLSAGAGAGILVEEDVPEVLDLVRRHDVLVIGMGLGAAEETKTAVRRIIEDEASRRVVVDADGFYGLRLPIETERGERGEEERGERVEGKEKSVVLTPHAGEFAKIPRKRETETKGEAEEFVKDFSAANGVVTLLKGATDIISDGVRVKLNRTGNAGMTVGGTGDVLAGLVGAFFAVPTVEGFKAATAAAFVNGAAGDLAFEQKGYGLLATDVVENIPKVLSLRL
ncbi:MAG: NAD(P)H-hydrate dehydratase [Methanophagales archaeon]|nr:NAD(P)H-hydrate dehydratase [Methanophagales archaeon]